MSLDLRPATDPKFDIRVVPVSTAATVEAWLRHHWDDALQVERLDALQALRVTTANSTYDIAIVNAADGEILVRGGKYFPGWTPVHLLGCSLGGGLLKRHAVHVGFRLELSWAGRIVITSPVRAVARTPEARSDSTQSERAGSPPPPARA
jgi:hypothetical protein